MLLLIALYFQMHFVFVYRVSSKLTAISGTASIDFKGLRKRPWETTAKQNSQLSSLSSIFFLFNLIIQLISFFTHEFDLINTVLSRHGDYIISLYQTAMKGNFSTLGHFFPLADMSVFLYLVLFCIHCKSKTLQRNFLDSQLLNKANQVPREQSCFLCLSASAVSSSKQFYSRFLRALQQKYFRSSKQKFPSARFTNLLTLLLLTSYTQLQ